MQHFVKVDHLVIVLEVDQLADFTCLLSPFALTIPFYKLGTAFCGVLKK